MIRFISVTNKNGFTLAEVLITLAIIGVVASLTLPALTTDTREQQAKAAFKKALNTLSSACEMNVAQNGYDFSTMIDTEINFNSDEKYDGTEEHMTLGALINENLKVAPNGYYISNSTYDLCKNCVLLMDGTSICSKKSMAHGFTGNNSVRVIMVDVNGRKGPNKISTCDEYDCKKKSGKHIKDQFAVTLYGCSAFPGFVNPVTNEPMEEGEEGLNTKAAMYVAK